MANVIAARRIKPKDGICDCCLKRRAECKSLLELHFCNYGCNFKVTLCDACLKDAYRLGMKAAESKGEVFKRIWEER